MVSSEPGTPVSTIFAHSLPDRPIEDWEPLSHHLTAVGNRAAEFAEAFGWKEAARVAGRLHDIGKCSAAFQAYIRRARESGEHTRGPDHSTAGARIAAAAYGALGRMLAFAIAGHHSGLADFGDLERRLKPEHAIEAFPEWQAHAGAPPPLAALRYTKQFVKSADKGFEQAFLTRMLFSCLVDADFLETERFYAEAEGAPAARGGHLDLDPLRERLRAYMAQMRAEAAATPLNALRAEVLDTIVERAASSPGLFTLTVPTGGGKILASLSFALEHAVRHGLRRVVYVIPFTSIIEQTAAVFREALNTSDDVLEHHASFDWERAAEARRDDGEGPDGLAKLRRAAENWDVPIVVTTAVQFFESLFAARTSRCRKLHNLAGSVIVLDEAQSLPIALLRPCMAALQELAANYNASAVLCTAEIWYPALMAMSERAADGQGALADRISKGVSRRGELRGVFVRTTLAGRLRLSGVRQGSRGSAEKPGVHLRMLRLWPADVDHCGHGAAPHQAAADGLVLGRASDVNAFQRNVGAAVGGSARADL